MAISLEQRLVDQGIITYVDHLVTSHEQPKTFAEDQRRIKEAVSVKAGGLFLYARLMTHQLLPKLGLESVGTLLDNLPSGLGDMHTSVLREHSSRSGASRELQLLILQSVTHASRTLRLLEIAEVI